MLVGGGIQGAQGAQLSSEIRDKGRQNTFRTDGACPGEGGEKVKIYPIFGQKGRFFKICKKN